MCSRCSSSSQAPILIHLAPTLHGHLRPGGRVALSGLVAQQADTVVARYAELFTDVQVAETEEGWALITARKK